MPKKLEDFTLTIHGKDYLPLMQGGMGVDISNRALGTAVASLGGVGHISDAMSPFISDRDFKTKFQSSKGKKFKATVNSIEKPGVRWDVEDVRKATMLHVEKSMNAKRGDTGGVFVNVMEKLQMGAQKDTLKARLHAVLDAGIDGVTLSAGLHKGSLALMADNPRFKDAAIGIIVSSARALKIFLRSAKRVNRYPDYVVVEGPLAGGHLGFGDDWASYDLKLIVKDVVAFLKAEGLGHIAVIPAGGVFTGTDAVEFIEHGAAGVQVATRFTIAKECGLPVNVKQEYARADEEDVEVNGSSPTGYLMRMLKNSPSLRSNIKPNCESLGYIIDDNGKCQYIDAYHAAPLDDKGKKVPICNKMCICYHFMKFNCYTCGQNVYKLKDTTVKLDNGLYYTPTAEQIFNDYMKSVDHEVKVATPVADSATVASNSSAEPSLVA